MLKIAISYCRLTGGNMQKATHLWTDDPMTQEEFLTRDDEPKIVCDCNTPCMSFKSHTDVSVACERHFEQPSVARLPSSPLLTTLVACSAFIAGPTHQGAGRCAHRPWLCLPLRVCDASCQGGELHIREAEHAAA